MKKINILNLTIYEVNELFENLKSKGFTLEQINRIIEFKEV